MADGSAKTWALYELYDLIPQTEAAPMSAIKEVEKSFLGKKPQKIVITYHPEGTTMAGTKPWRAKLTTPIHKSKIGWATNTLDELLDAIKFDAP